jgi:hypothetical protein
MSPAWSSIRAQPALASPKDAKTMTPGALPPVNEPLVGRLGDERVTEGPEGVYIRRPPHQASVGNAQPKRSGEFMEFRLVLQRHDGFMLGQTKPESAFELAPMFQNRKHRHFVAVEQHGLMIDRSAKRQQDVQKLPAMKDGATQGFACRDHIAGAKRLVSTTWLVTPPRPRLRTTPSPLRLPLMTTADRSLGICRLLSSARSKE